MLDTDELNTVLSAIGLDQFKEDVKIKNETRGRKPTDLYNQWYMILRTVYDYNHLAAWVDDVLTGAGRLSTGNSRISPKLVFSLLRSLPFISTREIKEYLNSSRTRMLWGDTVDDDSYCRWLRTVMLSAIRSLNYHSEQGKDILRYDESSEKDYSFDLRADMEGWKHERAKLK